MLVPFGFTRSMALVLRRTFFLPSDVSADRQHGQPPFPGCVMQPMVGYFVCEQRVKAIEARRDSSEAHTAVGSEVPVRKTEYLWIARRGRLTIHPLVPVPSICSSSSEPESPEVDAMFGDQGACVGRGNPREPK